MYVYVYVILRLLLLIPAFAEEFGGDGWAVGEHGHFVGDPSNGYIMSDF